MNPVDTRTGFLVPSLPVDEYKRMWGRNVRHGRQALGMSQKRLADLCDITQQSISSIEKGETSPRDHTKVRLAEALHQDVHQLFPLARRCA